MKQVQLIIILFVIGLIPSKSQNCKAYIPGKVGTEIELTQYDKKGKPTNINRQKLTNIRNSGDTTIFDIHQVITDEKGQEPMENNFSFKCLGETFFIDMDAYVDQKQMESYKNMDVKITTSEADIPASAAAGQTLKDGFFKMEMMAGAIPMTIKVDLINRKVEGFETITTPAGSFECIKLSQDIKSQFGFVKVAGHSITWYSENVGTVKSENYNQDKLTSYMLLTKITK